MPPGTDEDGEGGVVAAPVQPSQQPQQQPRRRKVALWLGFVGEGYYVSIYVAAVAVARLSGDGQAVCAAQHSTAHQRHPCVCVCMCRVVPPCCQAHVHHQGRPPLIKARATATDLSVASLSVMPHVLATAQRDSVPQLAAGPPLPSMHPWNAFTVANVRQLLLTGSTHVLPTTDDRPA